MKVGNVPGQRPQARTSHRNPIATEQEDDLTMIAGPALNADLPASGVVAARDFGSLVIVHACPAQVPEVMAMPKSLQWILDHQDELAERFERFQPQPGDERHPDAFRRLRLAIGGAIGTTGQAAQQRYGRLPKIASDS